MSILRNAANKTVTDEVKLLLCCNKSVLIYCAQETL
jgi:hypothetical protein